MASMRSLVAGPMPTQVGVPASTTVRPASRTTRTGSLAFSARAAISSSSAGEPHWSTILGMPVSILVGLTVLGAICTQFLVPETRARSLEDINNEAVAPAAAGG